MLDVSEAMEDAPKECSTLMIYYVSRTVMSGSGSWSLAHQTSYLPICGPPTLSHRALTLFAVPLLHSSEKVRYSRVETFRGVGIYQPAVDTAIKKFIIPLSICIPNS